MYAPPISITEEPPNITGSVLHTDATYLRRRLSSVWITVAPMVAVDAAAVLCGCLAAAFTVPGSGAPVWRPTLSAMAVALTCLSVWRQYPGWFLHAAERWRRIFWATGICGAVFGVARDAHSSDRTLSAAAGVLAWIVSCIAMILFRAVARRLLARCAWWGLPVVIIGSDAAGGQFADVLRRRRELGLRVVGRVATQCPCGSPVALGCVGFNGASGLPPSEYAVLVMSGLRGHELSGVIKRCGRGFRKIFAIWELEGLSSIAVTSGSIHGSFGIEIQQNVFRSGARATKRLLDVSVSLPLGLMLLPLFALICALTRLTSPGPVFYGQERMGRHGKRFTVWKFRTMILNADEVLRQCLNDQPALRQEWMLLHKLKNDPRITWVGRILRKSSLDELPQLWNILKGDMSLVGPRPIVDAEVGRYGDKYQFYEQVRPGVTGLWQVSGRNNTSYAERIALDRLYVRNWSLPLDIYILAKTVHVILTGDGAY